MALTASPLKVLVTDADERAALAAARSLGKRVTVHVAGSCDRSLAGSSRYVLASHRVPHPLNEPKAYASAVEALVRSLEIDVVVPISDAACTTLTPLAARLRPARIAGPGWNLPPVFFEKALRQLSFLPPILAYSVLTPLSQELPDTALRKHSGESPVF